MTTTANKVGYIYKIVCNDIQITECYVGSCNNMTKRKYNHKNNCNNENNKKYNVNVYQFIRANGGWANWNMVAIEQVNYTIKHEILLRERYHLERLGATLNKQIPLRTHQEYYEANKTEISEYHKRYNESNKTEISEYHKRYNKANKTEILEKKKEYYEANKTELNQKAKAHYEANKNKILENRKQLITCECGKSSTKYHILRHKQTKEHRQYQQIYEFIYS